MVIKLLSVVIILFAVTTTESARCPLYTMQWPMNGNFINNFRYHAGFLPALRRINKYAIECRVKIYVTNSFVKGSSASLSQPMGANNHLVGHAIDVNLLDGSRWCKVDCLFRTSKQTKGVKCFLSKIKGDAGLYWGGDSVFFPDVELIDDMLYQRDPVLYEQIYQSVQPNC